MTTQITIRYHTDKTSLIIDYTNAAQFFLCHFNQSIRHQTVISNKRQFITDSHQLTHF